jgi:hypothetical protein
MATTASDMVDLYTQAEADILAHGQSSAFNGRLLTTANLSEIRTGRQEWERRAAADARAAAGRSNTGAAFARFDS